MMPGNVASTERAPPPGVSLRSYTVTSTPACARVSAAARPLGPEPITLAVTICAPPFYTLDVSQAVWRIRRRVLLGRPRACCAPRVAWCPRRYCGTRVRPHRPLRLHRIDL